MTGDGVRVLNSNCPRQICRHAGTITQPSQTLVCVPNKVLVEIASGSGDSELNAVSY